MGRGIITRTYNGLPITFREDGYINMTKAAKHFGKKLDKFFENESSAEYMEVLSTALSTPKKGEQGLVHVRKGAGRHPIVGTWCHPKLAVFFARWLDVRFT